TAPSALLSLTITAGPLAVTPQTLPTGAVGEAYPVTTIGATGGVPPYTFSVISAAGTFPPGLTLNSNGSITNSPSPTTASTYNFTAQVKDSTNATAPGNFSIVINPALTISTPSTLPPARKAPPTRITWRPAVALVLIPGASLRDPIRFPRDWRLALPARSRAHPRLLGPSPSPCR